MPDTQMSLIAVFSQWSGDDSSDSRARASERKVSRPSDAAAFLSLHLIESENVLVAENMSIQLQWPIEELIAYAKRYAITHGLVSLVPDNLDYATIVPFSLYPSPFSYSHFQFIWSIQRDYNRLYQRVSLDDETLEKALTPVLPLDDFVSRLWKIHRSTPQRQPIQLDIYRSKWKRHDRRDDRRTKLSRRLHVGHESRSDATNRIQHDQFGLRRSHWSRGESASGRSSSGVDRMFHR